MGTTRSAGCNLSPLLATTPLVEYRSLWCARDQRSRYSSIQCILKARTKQPSILCVPVCASQPLHSLIAEYDGYRVKNCASEDSMGGTGRDRPWRLP